MKIIILGAGQVGSTIAAQLSQEDDNEITIVDANSENLEALQEKLDIRTVTGLASYPHVLIQAGVEDADMVVAVTSSDEVNMIACQIAHSLFKTPMKIARIRSQSYTKHGDELFTNKVIPIDVIISPEQVVTRQICRLIRYPGALQVLNFAGTKVRLVAIKVDRNSILAGHPASFLSNIDKHIDAKVVAIFRDNQGIIPGANTTLLPGDEIFFISANDDIKTLMSKIYEDRPRFNSIMIAGGGNIGTHVAKRLEADYDIKLIEIDPKHSERACHTLDRTIILLGDATDSDLLSQENIENIDIFCSLTNDDENNIMSAMQAKRLGAKYAISLINRPAYVDLVEGGDIDIAISPQHATIGALLAHIRRGDVEKVHSLRKGAAEAIEAVAHGDAQTSKVVGRKVSQLKLPEGSAVGAVVRGDQVYIHCEDITIQADDHVILFMTNKRKIRDIESLFQVSTGFL
ncbi:Trk system potassium transporter TrkA [Piscirickettsia litoralis]|uniref:Trk system potassium uptake protein TrkA n=1 Tax=Piscirickettsia litoralis TaxID=1891921 RepID=A0ABX3A3I9_9GAMM|nr:Trk system potassium transporter TrkA [Piscirickettsia litoralis]ODN43008.1 Trk system potassium transport protein TrkA [Piscirickettsia litoralis]